MKNLTYALMLLGMIGFGLIGCEEEQAKEIKTSKETTVTTTAKDAVDTAATIDDAGGCKTCKVAPGAGTKDSPVHLCMAKGIKIDGKADDWKDVPAMPAPFSEVKASPLKLAWNTDGLYGMLCVEDEKLVTWASTPWEGDALELWLDKKNTKAKELDFASQQYVFGPNKRKPGEVIVVLPRPGGEVRPRAEIKAAWTKTDKGYLMEFMIPAKEMAPAKLQEGTMLGLDFAWDNNGSAEMQFFNDKNTDRGFANPSTWGTVVLIKKK